MSGAVVSLNSGSSSIKFALFTLNDQGPRREMAGKIEGIGMAPRLAAHDGDGRPLVERSWAYEVGLTHEALLERLFDLAAEHLAGRELAGVGHRVVHGGIHFAEPTRVDDALLDALERLCPLAPLHQPHNLVAIRTLAALAPALPQVACFDTAFHHRRPEIATRFALPRALHDKGIRRYGFHGLSYEYVARRLSETDPELSAGRVIAAHLGNGASLCAMRDGRCVDTTMGFTALDGLMMGTRSGAIDPGVLLHLLREEAMTAAEIETLLYRQSGLLGVSGVSSDMRALHASNDPRAVGAIALFVWRAAREAGALVASLGGLDGLVFTAGIGENDPAIRTAICERLAWLGIELDQDANLRNAPRISTPDSRVTVRVIPTDEERMIAMHTLSTLCPEPSS